MSNVIRLGDYITEISEKTTVNNQHMVLTSSQEGIVSQDDYFNKQVASKDNTGYKIIRRGQFTYRAMSDTGRFYINRLTDYDIGIVSPAYPVFELRTNGQILPEYLQEYFHSEHFQNAITLSSTGSTRVSLKLAKIADLRIDIPTLPKQQCAVQAISHVNHLISMQNSSAAKLDQLVKSRFVEMFGAPITNKMGWPCLSLVKTCKAILGGGTPSKSHPEYFTGGIPWVSPKDMKYAVISDSIDHITEEAVAHSTTNLVPKNSVLMVIRSGILKHTLPVAINSVPVTINQDMKAFVPGNGVITEFLMYYFKAIESDVLAGVRGVTADNIDFKAFQQRTIIVPPLELQNRFAAFVAEVDKSKLAVKQSLEKLETLKKSLMQQYFG